MWVEAMLIASCFGAGVILQSALQLFSTGAASYSLETNYLDWKTPFPAVTVCEQSDNGRVKTYLNQFHPVETEYGVCYVFNSALHGNTSILTVNRKVGLPVLTFTAIELVTIRVHSPDDIVSVALENILGRFGSLPLITEFEAILKAEQTVNDVSVSSLSKTMRGCLFKNDRPSFPDWPFKHYTYSACLLYCRALAQKTFCNCSHHFMANIGKNIKTRLVCVFG
ncbi:unnamed protein product, partial [Brenthis ino]